MTTEHNANLSYESARLKLFRLSSISGEATARIEEAIDRELGTLHAASMGAQSFDTDAELTEAAGRCGLSSVALRDSVARQAAERNADVVLSKLDASELMMLKVLCGPDRVAQAERIVALRSSGKVGR
ncbi:MAG: hypothetical protein WCG85_02345 [Polyangia bacterium]